MKWLAIILVVVAILLLTGVLLMTIGIYNKREVEARTPLQVYESLLSGQTVASVVNSLSKSSLGDIGEFGRYDWPDSKVSGIGGSLHMNNPTNLSDVPGSTYVPQTKEGRPSIVGLT